MGDSKNDFYTGLLITDRLFVYNNCVVIMSDVLLEKINKIERMITELNAKIDNFLGYEDLTEEEKRESKKIREEIKKGEYVKFDEVFGKE